MSLPPGAAWAPPARDGVSPSRLVVAPGPGSTLAEYLGVRLRPGIDWRARLAQGDVVDVQGRPLAADAPCVPGQVLWYWRWLPPEPRVPFELLLLHQDQHLVVVDKPHFLASIPGGPYLQETVLVRLRRLLGNDDLMALHRLDRETAGVLLFSALPASRNAYHALMREQRMRKTYEAVALRAQLNALGLPILGDRIYPRLWPEPAADAPPDYSHPLQLLAREISFTDPLSGAPRHFVSGRQLALADAA